MDETKDVSAAVSRAVEIFAAIGCEVCKNE